MKHLVAYVLGLGTVAGWLATSDIGERRAWPLVHAMAAIPIQGRDAGAPERRAIGAKTPGVDLAGMDRSVAPGDNFWVYANGAWDKATAIPADRSAYGVDSILVDEARNRTIALIQESAGGARGDDTRKIGDFYASFMDEAGIEAKGVKPVKPELDVISAISDKRALARALGGSLRSDVDPLNATNFYTDRLFGLFVAQALDDPSRNVPYLLQGGLGMPDREYYLSDKTQMAELRTKYQTHVAAMLKLAGAPDADARSKATRIYALEKRMALVHATRVESEDVHGVISWKREELSTRAPGLDWAAFLEAAMLQKEARFFIWHPKATTGLAALVGSEPLDTWKDWLTYHAIERAAPWLSRAFVAERFEFYGKALSGTPQQRERWKRGVDFTNDALGEVVGKLYVQRYFSPDAKAKAQAMCDDLVKAFGRRIDTLAWMSPQTRTKAKEKLATLKIGIGYPDSWRDYSTLQVVRGDALGNATRAELFEYRRNLFKLGKSPDRAEWWMTPQTVNAVNLPLQNALNFPAAILQPPYFDPRGDAAINYGAIGAVIGHEISHSFDDVGSQFDAQGRLNNWWTKDDFAHFKAASEKLAAQYDAYRPFPDLTVNGHQTLGENIADVAGLSAAYDGFTLSLGGKPAPARQGLTGDQQFFISFAQSWRTKSREAALRNQIVTDGHAPAQYRADTVRNLDAWYAAFQVKPGQKLHLAPADRVRVW
jgi:predicted metalloendopeptidase